MSPRTSKASSPETNPVVEGLTRTLADSYLLMLKTHNHHWNVEGMNFQPLHTLFQTQYEELFIAIDEIAERIRVLGAYAPGSFAEFAKLSAIKEIPGGPKGDRDRIADLIASHETLVTRAKETVAAAEEAGDTNSADLLNDRVAVHQKTVWMLRSTVK